MFTSSCTGLLGAGRMEVQVQLQRAEQQPGQPSSRATYATLVVGSTQDDTLLLAQPLVLERVASPWVRTVTVQRVPHAQQPCVVVASVIMDRYAGDKLDTQEETHLPHTPEWLVAM